MNKITSVPPNYFYAVLIISILSWRFSPGFNIISYPYNLAGWIAVIIGMILTAWSWMSFRKHGTPEDFSASKVLVKDGPYRFSRNPMYLGMFLIVLGAAVCFRNLIGLISAIGFILVIHFMFIPYEEEKNRKTFGDEFLEYKRRVERWF